MIKTLISEEQLYQRITEVADELNRHYAYILKENEPLIVICVLKGAMPFCAELIKHLALPVQLECVSLSSYINNVSTGKVNAHICLPDVGNKQVLVVEDIIDTGITLSYFKDYLENLMAKVTIVTLLNKQDTRRVKIEPDYYCFNIDNKYVVGFGLDDNQLLRNLNYIGYKEI